MSPVAGIFKSHEYIALVIIGKSEIVTRSGYRFTQNQVFIQYFDSLVSVIKRGPNVNY